MRWRLVQAEGGKAKRFIVKDGPHHTVLEIRTTKPMTLDEVKAIVKDKKVKE